MLPPKPLKGSTGVIIRKTAGLNIGQTVDVVDCEWTSYVVVPHGELAENYCIVSCNDIQLSMFAYITSSNPCTLIKQ